MKRQFKNKMQNINKEQSILSNDFLNRLNAILYEQERKEHRKRISMAIQAKKAWLKEKAESELSKKNK